MQSSTRVVGASGKVHDEVSDSSNCTGFPSQQQGPSALCKAVWAGRIRIEFSLAATDLACSQTPRNYLVLAPRLSYLPVIGAPAVVYFRSYVVEMTKEIWFEGPTGVPLRR